MIFHSFRYALGPTERRHLPAPRAASVLIALVAAGCMHRSPPAPASPLPVSYVTRRVSLDVLADRVQSWRIRRSASDLRGLRLLYDTPQSGRPALAVVRSIVRANHRLDPLDALIFATRAVSLAREHRLDAGFFCAVLLQESSFSPDALSPAGAVGVGQFTLDTAAYAGVDPFDWQSAMAGSAALLGGYVRAYDGVYADPYAAALAAYNAGPGTVAFYHGVPPYPETRAYIGDIFDRWSRILRDTTGLRKRSDKKPYVAIKASSQADTESDPFAYLEDASDPRTIAWTAAQNARTRAALDALPDHATLAARFDALTSLDTLGTPVACGDRTFYTARRGAAAQTKLYVRSLGEERVLLDPASLDATGLTALDWWYPSPAGTFVAFGLSTNGDERSTLGVLEVTTATSLPDRIPDARYSSVAWYADESGFFYVRFPPGADYDSRVYAHRLGDAYERDPKVFGDGCAPEDMIDLAISANGRWLTARVSHGWSRNDLFLADTSDAPPRFIALARDRDAIFDPLPSDARIYVRTNEGAPRFRLLAIDPKRPERERWEEIVSESRGTLDAYAITRDAVVLHHLEDVRSIVRVRRGDGSMETLAGFGGDRSLLGLSANERSDAFFTLAGSFLEAPSIERVVVLADAPAVSSPWERVTTPFDARTFRVDQAWFDSKDGTRVPMWVIARRDLPRDGSAPAIVYGYGGFNVSLAPAFMPTLEPWLRSGGVYAIANLRGGGEFGEAWHRAGMRESKQNVFDDFIGAIEHLGASGIADPARIAVSGASNGGLLVAALAVQRPDLAAAVVCTVPLTDMLRFHRFGIGRLWISEYGDPDDPGDAAILRAYSPYHAVRGGVAYPAMLIESADSDGRVDPLHAKKFGARVLAEAGADAPVFVYVEPNAGHGAGKPRDKVVAELADRWSFLAWRLRQHLV